MNFTDIILVSVSSSLLLLYQILFVFEVFFFPKSVNFGYYLKTIKKWVILTMLTRGKETLAEDTLYNATRINLFVGSSLTTGSIFMLTYGFETPDELLLRKYQYIGIGILFMFGAFNIMISSKNYLHCEYVMNAHADPVTKQVEAYETSLQKKGNVIWRVHTKLADYSTRFKLDARSKPSKPWSDFDNVRLKNLKSAKNLLIRATWHYQIAWRVIYISIPFCAWLYSSWTMLGATVTMLPVMYYLDHHVELDD